MIRNKYDHLIDKYRHRFLHDRFKKLSVSRGEAPYLFRMVKQKELKMNDLVNELPFHKSHATRAISQLVEQGYITKQKDPNDKRGYILSITEKGEEIGERVDQIFRDWEAVLEPVLTQEDKEFLEKLSEKVYLRLKDYYKEDVLDEEDF